MCSRRAGARGASASPSEPRGGDLDRLLRRADFQRVYTGGVKVVGRYVVVFALAGAASVCRLGITTTRKIGGAVVRNRARRRIRELFRTKGELLAGWGGDVVVNVRAGCAGAGWSELAEDVSRCLSMNVMLSLKQAHNLIKNECLRYTGKTIDKKSDFHESPKTRCF